MSSDPGQGPAVGAGESAGGESVARVTSSLAPEPGRNRLDSIDLLRGIAMILMLLDHTRQLVAPAPYPTAYLDLTTVGLFMTRWITHIAAPAFLLLAGTGTYLYEQKRGTPATVRFLWTRGLWLIFLEITVVELGWLNLRAPYFGLLGLNLQVLWVIGVGLLLLAVLIRLPRWTVWIFSVGLMVGHNALDWIRPRHVRPFVKPFGILFRNARIELAEHVGLFFTWPLIPWVAVISLGYLLGALYTMEAGRRRRILTRAGWLMLVGFLVLRWTNLYGDPGPWTAHDRGPVFTVLSFLSLEKYPPSLLFLLMTLGASFVLLALFERARGPVADFFVAFGRVPLFFYLIHVPVAHLFAVVWSATLYGQVGWWFQPFEHWPPGYMYDLLLVYAATAFLVFLLLPMVRWFWKVKKGRRYGWLAYL